MNTYTFWFSVQGSGDTPQEAWESAMEAFAMDPGAPPQTVFEADDEIPSAEILGGNLKDGFVINEGET